MPNYLVLFEYDEKRIEEMSPEAHAAWVKQYFDWMQKLKRQNRYHGGRKLKSRKNRTLHLRHGKLVVDGPFAEAKEAIGGFFEISARDFDEAVEICRECPTLGHGGRVILSEVDPMSENG